MQSTQPAIPRSMQLALVITGALWLLASDTAAKRTASALTTRLNLPTLHDLFLEAFLAALLLVGLALLNWIATRNGSLRSTNSLPARPTTQQEFGRGVALGWALLLAVCVPLTIFGDLHPTFSFAPSAIALALATTATLLFRALALELAFRGYIYQRLIAAWGTTLATIVMSLAYAVVAGVLCPNSTAISFVVTFITAMVYSLAYLRTHGLWLGWGLHFAWDAATGVLLGLPVAGYATASTLVITDVSGRPAISGGAYGPEGSWLAAIAFLAIIPLLYRITRDYAWNYTHSEILPAGYPMDIPPPAAHTAMEAAAAPAPLVQILGSTPTAPSTNPAINNHLRDEREQ